MDLPSDTLYTARRCHWIVGQVSNLPEAKCKFLACQHLMASYKLAPQQGFTAESVIESKL
jgi:hypothetical protein